MGLVIEPVAQGVLDHRAPTLPVALRTRSTAWHSGPGMLIATFVAAPLAIVHASDPWCAGSITAILTAVLYAGTTVMAFNGKCRAADDLSIVELGHRLPGAPGLANGSRARPSVAILGEVAALSVPRPSFPLRRAYPGRSRRTRNGLVGVTSTTASSRTTGLPRSVTRSAPISTAFRTQTEVRLCSSLRDMAFMCLMVTRC